MRYTIITTTILRPSLVDTCLSVDAQTCTDWEHLIVVDRPEADSTLLLQVGHPQRRIIFCDTAHCNYGDTCKRLAHAQAQGDYIFYLDDDDVLDHPGALVSLSGVTGEWATFPSWSHGHILYSDPPAYSHLGGVNCLFRRDLPPWPDDTKAWGADWEYIAQLMKVHTWQAWPNLAPVARVEAHHYGK